MRRIVLAGLSATLAIGMFAAPVAAKGRNPPSPPDSSDTFPAGLVCAFEVRLDGWSKEKVKVTVDKHGREKIVVTGPARTLVTNTESGDSLTVKTNGRVEIRDPGDGTSRLKARGHTLFFFFPGDQNPAGEGNGLFLVHGQSEQTLDLSMDLVTSFELRGGYRDLCAELAIDAPASLRVVLDRRVVDVLGVGFGLELAASPRPAARPRTASGGARPGRRGARSSSPMASASLARRSSRRPPRGRVMSPRSRRPRRRPGSGPRPDARPRPGR